MSLVDCLKKFKLSDEDAASVKKEAKKYARSGLDKAEAEKRAVSDALEESHGNLEDLREQLGKQGHPSDLIPISAPEPEPTMPEPTEPKPANPVLDEVNKKLLAAGLQPLEAKQAADIHSAVFKTLGARLGIDPKELMDRYPLSVNGPESEKYFNQSAARADLPESVKSVVGDPKRGGLQAFERSAPKEEKRATQDKALAYAKEHFQGKSFENEHTGWEIDVSKKGLGKASQKGVSFEHNLALTHLDELIKNAVYEREAPLAESDGKYKATYDLYSPLRVGDTDHLVRLRIRETNDGKKFYDQLVVENEGSALRIREGSGALTGEPASGDRERASEGNGSPNIPIQDFLSDINQARQKLPLFQSEGDNPRGRIRFGENNQFSIDLFEHYDKSTFLHETGHLYLEILGREAEKADAPQGLKDDYGTILKYLGVDSKHSIKTEQHENFARSFEAYLMEGKAPTPELQGAFDKFRTWLVSLYKSMKGLNVNLTDDVRGVMDRMLASQEEIESAKRKAGMDDQEIPGADARAKTKIRTLQDRARDIAESTLMKEQMKELTEKNKEFLASERERQTETAKEQVNEEPLFKASGELEKDPQFNKYSGGADIADAFLRDELDSKQAGKMEALAEVHGFGSGEELAKAIILADETDSFDNEVNKRVDTAMAPHAALKDSGAIKVEAMKAIHTERMGEMLALEREVLDGLIKSKGVSDEVTRRNRVEARLEFEAAREHAKAILDGKSIKESGNPRTYITGERNAAVKAAKAAAAGDYEKASEFKRQQLLNHSLAAEAMKNSEEVASTLKYFDRIEKIGTDLKKAPYGFTRQVEGLLQRFGLTEAKPENTQTLIEIAKGMAEKGEDANKIADSTGFKLDSSGRWNPETLNDFVDRMNDSYSSMWITADISSAAGKPYKDLTLPELRSLKAAVGSVVQAGKNFNRFLSDFLKVDVTEAASNIRTSIEENVGTPELENLLPGSQHNTKLQKAIAAIKNIPGAFDRALDNMLTTCHKFDGLEEGPAKDYIYRPMKQAEDAKVARMSKVMQEVDKIFGDHYTPEEFGKYKDTKFQVNGRYFNKEEILSMALNYGNEGNRDRMMNGFKFDEATLTKLFQNLGKKDWDFAQATWDHIHKYWPDIVKLEMDVAGVQPEGVTPSEFTNAHGSYAGGYYPIAYDFDKSAEAFQANRDKNALYKQFSTAKTATEQGHAQARAVSVTRPLRLSLDVLKAHHENVIHDLEYRRAVIDVNRVLTQTDTKTAITNAVGVKGYAAMGDWLKAAASDQSEALSMGDKAARWFRFKTTFFNLGFRLVSTPKIAIENMANVSSELGISGASRAIKNYYFGDQGIHEMIMEKSSFMKQRANHLDRDLGDITDKYRDEAPNWFQRNAFILHSKIDQGMSHPLWADVYSRGFAEHQNEALAVNQADEAVKRTFMSGGHLDQSAMQRGSESQKLVTMAMSYQAMMWNRFSQQRFAAGTEWAQGNKLAAAHIAAKATVYTFLLPAMTAALTREILRNNQQSDEDESKKRILGAVLEEGTPLKFVPILRDLAPYLIKKAQGEHSAHYQATPLEDAAQTLLDPTGQVLHAAFGGGTLDPKFAEQTAKAVSLVSGVPKQLNDVVFNFLDWQQNNGEATWRDFLTRRTKK